jgi:hypothetical protein
MISDAEFASLLVDTAAARLDEDVHTTAYVEFGLP